MKIAGGKRREWALSNRWHGQVGVGAGVPLRTGEPYGCGHETTVLQSKRATFLILRINAHKVQTLKF